MILFVILGVIGFSAVTLGLKSFTAEGLALTKTSNITGEAARIIGAVCIVFGLACWGALIFIVLAANSKS